MNERNDVNALDCENKLFYPPFKLPAEKTGMLRKERVRKRHSLTTLRTPTDHTSSLQILLERENYSMEKS